MPTNGDDTLPWTSAWCPVKGTLPAMNSCGGCSMERPCGKQAYVQGSMEIVALPADQDNNCTCAARASQSVGRTPPSFVQDMEFAAYRAPVSGICTHVSAEPYGMARRELRRQSSFRSAFLSVQGRGTTWSTRTTRTSRSTRRRSRCCASCSRWPGSRAWSCSGSWMPSRSTPSQPVRFRHIGAFHTSRPSTACRVEGQL